jgi:hypothetical protein
MKRTNWAIWLLFWLQLAPLLVGIAGASGALDPFGQFVVRHIPLPGTGENRGWLINVARFVTAHWFFACVALPIVGSLIAVFYVAFDGTLSKLERVAWAISFILGQSVTVVLYCVLRMLGSSRARHVAAA